MRNCPLGWRYLFVVPIFAFTLSVTVTGQKAAGKFVPDEVLIKLRTGTNEKTSKSVAQKLGATVVERLGDLGWIHIKLRKGQTVDEAIGEFSKIADVEAVQPNFYYRIQTTPNDALWSDLYGMVKISAPAAWDLTTGSSEVVVADIDTGFDYTHEDLAANAWTNPGEIPNNGMDDDNNGFVDDYYGYDFRYNDPDPMDEESHGTHTAGTIGAVGNNSIGVAGVNWHVKIMGIKIYSATADDSTSAMVINAYNYVRMMKLRGVNIVATNNSYGGCPETCGSDVAVKQALDAMGDAGILNVFAAGNSGTDNDQFPFFPASYDSPSILAVGGSDQNDNRIFNYGATSVDIAAPGSIIKSTVPAALQPAKYWNSSGTSMSAPHVTGAAALLASYNPSLSAASLKATLINSADVLPAFMGANRAGGRLNVFRALTNQTICSFNLSTNSVTMPTKGGVFTINVGAGSNCDLAATPKVKWIHVEGSRALSGTGNLTFRVGVNQTISRSGTISIAGQTVTVTQSRKN